MTERGVALLQSVGHQHRRDGKQFKGGEIVHLVTVAGDVENLPSCVFLACAGAAFKSRRKPALRDIPRQRRPLQLFQSVRFIEPSMVSTSQISSSGNELPIRRQAGPIAFARCGRPIPNLDGRAITHDVALF